MTQVYKFGGASIATPERMKALFPLIEQAEKPLAVVVSAYGKTTNALEEVVWAVLNKDKSKARQLANGIKEAHYAYSREALTEEAFAITEPALNTLFDELNWGMEDVKGRQPDYIYDQIVSIGELLSTTIFAAFLNDRKLKAQWIDARDVIRTNDCYRDAKVDEIITRVQIQEKIVTPLQDSSIVVTQGFIGSTAFNAATTLGREGSDYTGALLAAMIPAASLSIWKDVEGLLNADPRKFSETIKISEITYHEVIEMAFYGAQVIHPKTIKPLQNANIPLWVKCFLKPELNGTLIHNTEEKIDYPPLIVLKDNQTLLQITSRDFSFITEGNLSRLYQIFHQYQVKINLIQNAAISVVFVVNNEREKVLPLIADLEKEYRVLKNNQQQLLTIRHFNTELIEQLTKNRAIILTQKTRNTIQMVLDNPEN